MTSRFSLLLSAAVVSFCLVASPVAFAQDKMSNDGMKKTDTMSKDGMSKDGMKKDDAMTKDGMKKDGAMAKDGMKKDEMKK